jgi:predicted RNA polymerase sigma factor
LIPMAEQDRSLWNAESIAEGVALITDALPRGPTGPYQLQTAIAAIHDEAPSADATDWPQILVLFELLMQAEPTPPGVPWCVTIPGGGTFPRSRGSRY